MKVAADGMFGPEGSDLRVVSRAKLRTEYIVGGLDSVFQLGAVSSGLEVHCKLRQLGMVQNDECLHMRFKLRELVMCSLTGACAAAVLLLCTALRCRNACCWSHAVSADQITS
jgi:hypothetical protein